MWVDAGICVYRNKKPPSIIFPNIEKLNNLPRDKFIYSSSKNSYISDKFKKGKYYLNHHVSGNYILHKNVINKCALLYKKYLKLIDKNDIWTDQVILTLMYRDNKDFFYKYCDGYGILCEKLF